MGKLRNFVTFITSSPDDPEAEPGEFVVPAGRSLSEIIAGLLKRQGFDISGGLQHRFYGWEMTARRKGEEYWFLLQRPDHWLLIAEDRTSLISRLTVGNHALHRTLGELHLMMEDAGFTQVRWFTRAEYESEQSFGSTFL